MGKSIGMTRTLQKNMPLDVCVVSNGLPLTMRSTAFTRNQVRRARDNSKPLRGPWNFQRGPEKGRIHSWVDCLEWERVRPLDRNILCIHSGRSMMAQVVGSGCS